jgi:hypothetical protein
MGLANDTHSDAAQFFYLATTFYVAYFVFELPSGYLVQRLPLAKYLGANSKIDSQFQLVAKEKCCFFDALMSCKLVGRKRPIYKQGEWGP